MDLIPPVVGFSHLKRAAKVLDGRAAFEPRHAIFFRSHSTSRSQIIIYMVL